MKIPPSIRKCGFTLVETVIAIGVLAVLLTGFMYVFAPAADGIKRAIGIQEADRLSSTLEQELVTLRPGATEKTAFEKAFAQIKSSNTAAKALMIYQYRGNPSSLRADGTPTPVVETSGKIPGKDYVLQTMMRLKDDPQFAGQDGDLGAVEGRVYFVICNQLVFKNSQLQPGTLGTIADPVTEVAATSADVYPAAVIAFLADFHVSKNKSPAFFGAGFEAQFTDAVTKKSKPLFSRNLAVRR